MTIHELLAEFRTKRILVIGDVMIDAYLLGKVNRVSPEAPVPIVSLTKHEQRLGGAANVALNLLSLGATPILCSVVGDDKDGDSFLHLLNELSLSIEGIVRSSERVTTIKTRVIGNQQHLLRIDAEDTHELSIVEGNQLLVAFEKIITEQAIDAIILEDYNKGVLSKSIIEAIVLLANHRGIPTAVDPKKEHFLDYKGVTLFKPNLKELREGTGIDCTFQNTTKFNEAIARLEDELNNKITFVTLSESGVYIKEDSHSFHTPAHLRTILDVSGAGDTVISVATLCLASGRSIQTIAELSNLAGGLVCEKSGVVSIDPNQLIQESEGKNWN